MEPDLNKDVQRYAKNTKKNNRRNYDCNARIVWSLTPPTRNHYAFGKDQGNCYAFLSQEQAIQQDFTSCPHLIAELLFSFPKHDNKCANFRISSTQFRFLLLQNRERRKKRDQHFDANSICLTSRFQQGKSLE